MPSRHSRLATLLSGLALLLLGLGFGLPTAASGAGTDAGASIVHGKPTTIKDWPWQVALVMKHSGNSTRRDFFCGGSVLAPRIVLTAAHCVVGMTSAQRERLRVISGRTRLNSTQGETTAVSGIRIAPRTGGRNSTGRFSFRVFDVALLKLAAPVEAEPIKLAGSDEGRTFSTGQVVWTTGWGKMTPWTNQVPDTLRKAKLVVQSDRLCGLDSNLSYPRDTLLCLGSAEGHSSACSGDSGGPLVAWTTSGYRLVGATSGGDRFCRGYVPSFFAKVSGDRVRSWIVKTARKMTDYEIVGSGGKASPKPDWCRVPRVFRLKLKQAKRNLRAAGCRVGTVKVDRRGRYAYLTRRFGPGRVIGYELYQGWLAPKGFRMDLLLTGHKPR